MPVPWPPHEAPIFSFNKINFMVFVSGRTLEDFKREAGRRINAGDSVREIATDWCSKYFVREDGKMALEFKVWDVYNFIGSWGISAPHPYR